jgi:glycosyl transferase family 25
MWPASTPDTIVDHFPFYLNGGQRGCAQSHILIWRHVLEHDLEYALILEDDARFDKEWKSKIDRFCESNQDMEWDAVFLNASEPIEPRDTWVCTKEKEQYLTAGYVISKKGARTLLNDFKDCFFSSDWMTSRLQLYGHSYCYFPWLIIQEGKDSDIGSNLEADREKVLRCLNEIHYSLENYV